MSGRWVLLLGLLGACACQTEQAERGGLPSLALPPLTLPPLDQGTRVALAEDATTRLDVEMAAGLLEGTTGPRALVAKARLALYQADCAGALAHLPRALIEKEKLAAELAALATSCQGATAGAAVFEDRERGVWIRYQDEADAAIAPLLVPVIERARAAIGVVLGVDLPRPLRLDLVRDLFSLSAVSGLPIDAAETTGTVAVARWGRVTMLSPRAVREGYPWADTLAHELTHLLLSRSSADRAPLWLQEGVAKRLEERWRDVRPFDGDPDPDDVALSAARAGRSVGVTQLGPSIAMLPSADAARIAFAEVASFMGYWMERNGPRALPLLLRDLRVASDADGAMRSVSGLGISDWELLWRQHLEGEGPSAAVSEPEALDSLEFGPRALSRALRASELLYNAGHLAESSERARGDLEWAPHVAALRFAAVRGLPDSAEPERQRALGTVEDVDGPYGGWLALLARELGRGESRPEAEQLRQQALHLDPFLPEVACSGGAPDVPSQPPGGGALPQTLCDQVRGLPPRGSR